MNPAPLHLDFSCTNIDNLTKFNKVRYRKIGMKQTLQQAQNTRKMILEMEAIYQRELSEGFGINSESMKAYAKIRDEGLSGVARMTEDRV